MGRPMRKRGGLQRGPVASQELDMCNVCSLSFLIYFFVLKIRVGPQFVFAASHGKLLNRVWTIWLAGLCIYELIGSFGSCTTCV